MSQYFPKPYEPFGGDIYVKFYLSNYAAKTDLKSATGTDTIKLASKSDSASLKAEIDKLNIDKLVSVPVDLSKSTGKNDVVKKTIYDKLVAKVNNIDISGFAIKTKYDKDKSNLEKKVSNAENKIPDTSGLVKKLDYNAKISEVGGKISSITGLATTSALTLVENKILNVSNLVKKTTDYDTKISEIEKRVVDHNHDKYLTTPEFKNFTADIFLQD